MDRQNRSGGNEQPPQLPGGADSTVELMRRAKQGDRDALDRLFARYMRPLHRFASGRLPPWARDVVDTDDLVQETLLKTVRNVGTFEPQESGSFHAYLRQGLKNRIRDEVKKAARSPAAGGLERTPREPGASPLEQTIGRQALERYERALERLQEDEREAVVARIELGMSYEEVARAVGKPSSDAARMMVSRALVRLAKEMGHER
jgi:RNA polymerase sigma-70 factor (ECF subfamily)